MDYTTRTRQDWLNFEQARSKAFEPTSEELEQERIVQEEARRQDINDRLSSRGIVVPSPLTKQWMLAALSGLNAKAFVGKDVELRLDGQIEYYGSIESALDNLVITYL